MPFAIAAAIAVLAILPIDPRYANRPPKGARRVQLEQIDIDRPVDAARRLGVRVRVARAQRKGSVFLFDDTPAPTRDSEVCRFRRQFANVNRIAGADWVIVTHVMPHYVLRGAASCAAANTLAGAFDAENDVAAISGARVAKLVLDDVSSRSNRIEVKCLRVAKCRDVDPRVTLSTLTMPGLFRVSQGPCAANPMDVCYGLKFTRPGMRPNEEWDLAVTTHAGQPVSVVVQYSEWIS